MTFVVRVKALEECCEGPDKCTRQNWGRGGWTLLKPFLHPCILVLNVNLFITVIILFSQGTWQQWRHYWKMEQIAPQEITRKEDHYIKVQSWYTFYFICLFIYLFIFEPTCASYTVGSYVLSSICLSVCLSVCLAASRYPNRVQKSCRSGSTVFYLVHLREKKSLWDKVSIHCQVGSLQHYVALFILFYFSS